MKLSKLTADSPELKVLYFEELEDSVSLRFVTAIWYRIHDAFGSFPKPSGKTLFDIPLCAIL
jgi:hypothetical protein